MFTSNRRYWLTGLIVVLLALGLTLITGCGGSDIDDDDGYSSGEYGYPQYKNLTIILRVVDPEGVPIGGASVWVDEHEDDETTDRRLHPLGDGYPRSWRGWLANWTSDDYRVVMNYSGDQDTFTIAAGKHGYWSDETRVAIGDWEPDEIFVRDELVLVPKTGVVYQAQVEDKQADKVEADTDFEREPEDEPSVTIGAE
ncbi:MAG: hypothetical protein R6V19_07235 [Armatimonadota bacterium]